MSAVAKQLRKFEGDYMEKMPLLVQVGLRPATMEEIMQLRLEETLSFDRYYDSSTGIAYAGDNKDKFKLIPSSKDLIGVNPKTELYSGGIILTPEQYQAIQAQELTREDALFNQRLTEKQVLKHPAWLAAVNNDKELLRDYTSEVFRLSRELYNKIVAMGFFIGDLEKVPNLHALNLDIISNSSDAYGDFYLYDDACLVGIRTAKIMGCK